MTDRKPELPEHAKVFEDALWDNSSPAVEAEDYEEVYEALRVSLTKLAAMEELLREMQLLGANHLKVDVTMEGQHVSLRNLVTLGADLHAICRRVDALLEGK
jgi:hypothetical protein